MTKDLFDWEPPNVAVGYAPEVAGHGPLENKIARTISQALDDARENKGRSRKVVAELLSEHLGRTVSEAMLNKWASEGSEHRIPLDAFIALIRATDADDLLGFIPRQFGFEVMPERYKAIIELHLIDEHEQQVANRKQELLLRVRGLK